jgi:hypothetical protein
VAVEKDSGTTALMRQYLDIKSKYPDAILFFRLGDFYEMFYEDAVYVSRALSLTLTSRDKGKEDPTPMCGCISESKGETPVRDAVRPVGATASCGPGRRARRYFSAGFACWRVGSGTGRSPTHCVPAEGRLDQFTELSLPSCWRGGGRAG